MCTYLSTTRPVYYFRRGIPAELRPFLDGKHEFSQSLGTKDRAAAKQLIPAITIETDALLASARERLDAGELPAAGPVDDQSFAMSERDMAVMEHEAAVTARRDGRLDQLEPFIAFAEKRLKGSTERMPRALRAFKHILDGERYDKETLRSHLAIARATIAELQGGQSPETPRQPSPGNAVASVPMLATFDAYAKAQAMTAGVAKEWRASVAGLVQFIGHDDAARLTVDHVVRWRDKLAKEVTSRGTVRAPATVKKRVGTVATMLRWAVEERLLPDNVGAGVIVRTPRKAKLRDPDFTDQEALAILTASLIPASKAMAAGNILARRWIPWLCAYSGARVNELSQLRGQDITETDGIWAMRITPEAGTTKDKNFRVVPLHPHIIEQGFIAAIAGKGDGPLFYDPKAQRVASLDNRHFKKVGTRLAEWVRKDVGITDAGVKPNHGWRHTFKTQSMRSDMPERVADAIQGHAPRSVGQSYGSVPLAVKAKAIAGMPRFNVPGLELPKLKTR